MKLKKGSLEAKRFMAKIRAKKGNPKATVNGWKKGNTRMLEVNEPVFKTKKNVRVKRRKLGTFKKFTTLSGFDNKNLELVGNILMNLQREIYKLKLQIKETKKLSEKKPLKSFLSMRTRQYNTLKKYYSSI